ncbi:MAG: tRNA lysidine(34) synthetase TilS [Burkholderiales bacterium]|nr:tRNA lysidine(34) synthetase TilS [Burkholderiales bacterium]
MDALAKQVGVVLRRHVPHQARIAVGLSGGIDSVVLLHLLVRQLRVSPQRMLAVHVNHQISAHATDWARFCRDLCRKFGVKLRVVKVEVARGNSTEAAARAARQAVFADCGADVVVLAHNRDDQAETLLLQLLRGAGPRGLAAMPALKAGAGSMPAVLRPLLEMPRKTIAAYAQRHRLQWVEDESNQDRGYLRNFLRHDVLPLLEQKLPGAGATLARGARHQAEASDLLDTLAAQDLGPGREGRHLSLALLKTLASHRARNVLRYFLRCNNLLMPEADRLDELLRQALTARSDARVCVDMGGAELRRFQNELHIVRPLPRLVKSFAQAWSGRGVLKLPQLGGSLHLEKSKGEGIAAAVLRSAPLLVRIRQGGEVLRPVPGGRSRTVRNLLQEAVLPPWKRERLPFLYVGGELVAVVGLGVDAKFQPVAGGPGLLPVWVAD